MNKKSRTNSGQSRGSAQEVLKKWENISTRKIFPMYGAPGLQAGLLPPPGRRPNPPPPDPVWPRWKLQAHLSSILGNVAVLKAIGEELESGISSGEAGDEGDGGGRTDLAALAARQLVDVVRAQVRPLKEGEEEGKKRRKVVRNRRWRARRRRAAAEAARRERERHDEVDRAADEWRAREMARAIARRKMERMRELAERTTRAERARRLEDAELALVVEKLQELRALRVARLKKQGRFFPDEDDRFVARVREAVEAEERLAAAAASPAAAAAAILSAEEARAAALGDQVRGPDDPSELDGDPSRAATSDAADGKNATATAVERTAAAVAVVESGLPEGWEGLPAEFYQYYFGSSFDMRTLIEVRQAWDAFIMPGGSRIPQRWIEAPPPADAVWASYLVRPSASRKRRRRPVQ